jgi:hypothetical protein
MQIPIEIQNSIPFQYAADVKSGKTVCGLRIKQSIVRFYKLIENAEENPQENPFCCHRISNLHCIICSPGKL